MTFDWADMSFQERRAPGVAVVFALAIFLVFLILAAQYESWGLPFSVLLGTPFAAFGAYLGLWLARQFSPSYVNNVFAQIGLIMLIGLAAKNAILIVEFAKMEQDQGKGVFEAAMSAAKLRFRPILMTAFAFILGVVPLLTASGAGAEARKVMGMTVFSGMLIATILGVLLIPMLYVAVEKVVGGRRSTRARAGAHAAAEAGRRARARGRTDMRRSVALARLVLTSAVAWLWLVVRLSAPTTRGRRCRVRRNTASSQGPAQAESLADMPWLRVFDDPALQALIREAIANNLDLRVAVARVEEARARAGIAKSYLYPQVDGVASYGVRQASNACEGGGCRGGGHDAPERRRTAFSCPGSSTCSAASGARTRRRWRSCWRASRGAAACSSRSSATWRRSYFLLRELDLQLEIARRTLAPQRRDGHCTSGIGWRAACRTGSSSTASSPTGRRPRRRSRRSSSRSRWSRTRSRCCSDVRRGRSTREALGAGEAVPPPIPPGLPASLLERRPDVVQAEQLLVAANADIGVAKALFFPTISLTGFLGGVSGDLTTFLGGDGAVWSVGAGLLQPMFQAGRLRRNLEAAQARFDAALAAYQKAALNGYREVANSLVDDPEAGRGPHRAQEVGVAALQDASESVPRALRFRARQLHRDPDRRSGTVPAAAAAGADAGRGAARARGAVPHARRRLAAVDREWNWMSRIESDQAALQLTEKRWQS